MSEKKELIEKLAKYTQDGKIACMDAFRFAQETNTTLEAVGKILNEEKIKIIHCQLGCFP
jgi:hypothetical protein